MQLNHYNKGTFKKSPLRYWTGTKWEYANLKRWNGTEWASCIKNPLDDFFIDTTNKCLVEPNGELARHYSSTYFTYPYVYYYKNKLSYRIVNHYADSPTPWSMDIEIWNPWTGKLIMSKNIRHEQASSLDSLDNPTIFNSSLSVTNNKIFIFYSSIDGYFYRHDGAYSVTLNLQLNVISMSDCRFYNSFQIEKYIHTLNTSSISILSRLDGIDYVSTYDDKDNPKLEFKPIRINYDTGVCSGVMRIECSLLGGSNYVELNKAGLYVTLYRNTDSNTPTYDWALGMGFKVLVYGQSIVTINEYPSSLFKGGATLYTTIDEFKYGGMQRRLNNTKLFGMLLPKYNTHFLDGCVITFPLKTEYYSSTYDRYYRYVTALSGTNENYLTFRKIWGNPSLDYTIYENMNGINLANKILNFDSAKNKLTFRHLPNGQTLMYFDNDIFNFTQKNDKFYISYYGTQTKDFAVSISEPYGCNKEIIE